MQKIVNFIIRNKTFLLFLFLFSISIVFTIQSNSYRRSKFVNSANFLSGGIYNKVNNIAKYFNLEEQNRLLQEENKQLKAILFNRTEKLDSTKLQYKVVDSVYEIIPATVIKNSFSLNNNILLINKGEQDSIQQDFGVVTSQGILGIVDQVSTRFSTVLSILNTKSKISAQLQNSRHYGTLQWNANAAEFVQLIDVPSKANLQKGDTICTSGRSAIFPKGIPIGIVNNYRLDEAENFYEIDVKLFTDMTNVEHAYIIKNNHANEINNLLISIDE